MELHIKFTYGNQINNELIGGKEKKPRIHFVTAGDSNVFDVAGKIFAKRPELTAVQKKEYVIVSIVDDDEKDSSKAHKFAMILVDNLADSLKVDSSEIRNLNQDKLSDFINNLTQSLFNIEEKNDEQKEIFFDAVEDLSNEIYEDTSENLSEAKYGGYAKAKTLFQSALQQIKESKPLLKSYLALTPKQKREKALTVANKLNQSVAENPHLISVEAYVREPLTNPTKNEGLVKPAEKYVKLVSFERFQVALLKSFIETLGRIQKSPENERKYIIVGDRKNEQEEKSSGWVTSLLLGPMSIHPPEAIVQRDKLRQYLKDHPGISHIVLIDDAAYSGAQMSTYIQNLNGLSIYLPPQNEKPQLLDKTIHVCVPFITKYAEQVIKNGAVLLENQMKKLFNDYAIKLKNIDIAPHQRMLTYEELIDYGFFGMKEKIRPDLELLLDMPPLLVQNVSLSSEEKAVVQEINDLLAKLKKEMFRVDDEAIRKSANELKSKLEIAFPKGREIEEMKQFSDSLERVATGIERFGTDVNLSDSMQYDYVQPKVVEESEKKRVEGLVTKTPTWMAHKNADNISTDRYSMELATKHRAIEPYKGTRGFSLDKNRISLREEQIKELKAVHSEISDQWDRLKNDTPFNLIELIKTNRGYFLLGENYVTKSLDNSNQVMLVMGNERIPFGGSDGAYQWKLEEGMTFSLEKDSVIKNFQFKGNQIFVF